MKILIDRLLQQKAGKFLIAVLCIRLKRVSKKASFIMLAGSCLYVPTTANQITVIIAGLNILIGIGLEEHSLLRQYREECLEYKKGYPC